MTRIFKCWQKQLFWRGMPRWNRARDTQHIFYFEAEDLKRTDGGLVFLIGGKVVGFLPGTEWCVLPDWNGISFNDNLDPSTLRDLTE